MTASWSVWAHLREHHPQVWVHRCRLDEGLSWWCPDEQVILVDDRLGPLATRCAIAHELGHAALGHEACHDYGDADWLALRLELAADRWAAERLVPLRALAGALAAYREDVDAMAEQLHVTAEVVRTRLAMLTAAERVRLRRGRGEVVA